MPGHRLAWFPFESGQDYPWQELLVQSRNHWLETNATSAKASSRSIGFQPMIQRLINARKRCSLPAKETAWQRVAGPAGRHDTSIFTIGAT